MIYLSKIHEERIQCWFDEKRFDPNKDEMQLIRSQLNILTRNRYGPGFPLDDIHGRLMLELSEAFKGGTAKPRISYKALFCGIFFRRLKKSIRLELGYDGKRDRNLKGIKFGSREVETVSEGKHKLIMINHVPENSSWEQSGFREGQVVSQVDNNKPSSISDIRRILKRHENGNKVVFEVLENGVKKRLILNVSSKVIQEKTQEVSEDALLTKPSASADDKQLLKIYAARAAMRMMNNPLWIEIFQLSVVQDKSDKDILGMGYDADSDVNRFKSIGNIRVQRGRAFKDFFINLGEYAKARLAQLHGGGSKTFIKLYQEILEDAVDGYEAHKNYDKRVHYF